MPLARLNMIAAIVAIGGAAGFAYFALGAAEPEAVVVVEAPKAELVVEPGVVDLGTASQNQLIGGTYQIINRLPVAVNIQQVAKSCSCAEPEVGTKHLEPGASTTLTVAWKTGTKRNKVSDRITIMATTATTPPQNVFAELVLRANIEPDVTLNLDRVNFDEGQSFTKTISIATGTLKQIKLLQAYASCKGFTANVNKEANTVSVIYIPAELPKELGDMTVLIETTSTVEKWIRVPIVLTPKESKP